MRNKIGLMIKGLDDVAALQTKAYDIKQWLTNNHNADIVAIREQRKKLKETLLLIIKTVKNDS